MFVALPLLLMGGRAAAQPPMYDEPHFGLEVLDLGGDIDGDGSITYRDAVEYFWESQRLAAPEKRAGQNWKHVIAVLNQYLANTNGERIPAAWGPWNYATTSGTAVPDAPAPEDPPRLPCSGAGVALMIVSQGHLGRLLTESEAEWLDLGRPPGPQPINPNDPPPSPTQDDLDFPELEDQCQRPDGEIPMPGGPGPYYCAGAAEPPSYENPCAFPGGGLVVPPCTSPDCGDVIICAGVNCDLIDLENLPPFPDFTIGDPKDPDPIDIPGDGGGEDEFWPDHRWYPPGQEPEPGPGIMPPPGGGGECEVGECPPGDEPAPRRRTDAPDHGRSSRAAEGADRPRGPDDQDRP